MDNLPIVPANSRVLRVTVDLEDQVLAYMYWPRLRQLRIFDFIPFGERIAIVSEINGEVFEHHFLRYQAVNNYGSNYFYL